MLTTKIKTYLNIRKISIFKPVNLNVYLKLDGVALLITDPPPASSTPLICPLQIENLRWGG